MHVYIPVKIQIYWRIRSTQIVGSLQNFDINDLITMEYWSQLALFITVDFETLPWFHFNKGHQIKQTRPNGK